MVSKAERSSDSQSREPTLSQQELDPKVRGLLSDFKQALRGIPEFQEALVGLYFSPYLIRLSGQNFSLVVMFSRGLDRWTVRDYIREEDEVLAEYLSVTVDKPSKHTQGFRIVTLRIPYLADIANAKKDYVEISYQQKKLLVASSPTDTHHNNTASAITGAEKMLAELKTTPNS